MGWGSQLMSSVKDCETQRLRCLTFTLSETTHLRENVNFKLLFHGWSLGWVGFGRSYPNEQFLWKGQENQTKKLFLFIPYVAIQSSCCLTLLSSIVLKMWVSWGSSPFLNMKRMPLQIVSCLGRRSCSQEEIHRTPWIFLSLSLFSPLSVMAPSRLKAFKILSKTKTRFF